MKISKNKLNVVLDIGKTNVKLIFLKMTPRDFGLKVRNHPESLIVTARNKMRSAKTIVRVMDWSGQDIQTSRLYSSKAIVGENI